MLFTTVIVSDCLAGGLAAQGHTKAGSGGLRAGSGRLQSEGWGLALVLGGSIGLALGYLVPVAPESLQNVENVLFL